MRIAASSLCCAVVLLFCTTVMALPIASVSGEDTNDLSSRGFFQTLLNIFQSDTNKALSEIKEFSDNATPIVTDAELQAAKEASAAQSTASEFAGRAAARRSDLAFKERMKNVAAVHRALAEAINLKVQLAHPPLKLTPQQVIDTKRTTALYVELEEAAQKAVEEYIKIR